MAATVSDDPRVGTTIAGYRIERFLGRGGMGTVYLAEDLALARKVALKVLSPEFSENAAFRERIRLESRLAASIDHPNVIPIYEAGQAPDGTLFIAMRYVEGADLKQILRRDGALDPQRAVELLGQAARGLDAAHARGLVHRDVKPSNVLVAMGEGDEEHVYLADFGLTQIATSPEAARESITLSGSSDYVSPEQIRGTGSDNASDAYGLGCVAYECLTGEVPFPMRSEPEVLFAHMNDEPPRPSTVNPELPSALDAVMAKAMSKEPNERYTSGTELVDAIRDATASRRRFGGWVMAGLAGLLAVIVAAAVIPAVLLTGDGETAGASAASAALAPESATITTVAGTGESGFSGDGGKAILAELDNPDSIAFDASGNLFVADTGNMRIRRIDRSGVITTIAGTGARASSGDGGPAVEAELALPISLVFDPAGNLYFAELDSRTVRKIDADGLITTVAGGGTGTADSGLATEAQLRVPWVTVDADGILYITDQDDASRGRPSQAVTHRILRVDPDGTYTTIAGAGYQGSLEDGGPATEARLRYPCCPSFGPDGSLYFSDGTKIRRIDQDGIITTVAGTTLGYDFSGRGGPAIEAHFIDVHHFAWDSAGALYFSHGQSFDDAARQLGAGSRILRIDSDGILTSVVGTGQPGFSGDRGPAIDAELNLPSGLAFDADGNLYIADQLNHRIRKVTFEAS